MADKTIGSLPSVESVNDDSLIPAEQQGEAVKVTGAQFKSFAQKSVAGIVDQAKGYADQAAQSAAEAAESVTQIVDAVEQTQANKEAAQAAQAAAEAASQGVQEYANQAAQSASQASESAAEATLQAQGAAQSAESAQTAKNAAELAEADAQAAKTAAQLAQTSAEQARDSAAASATTAQENATQASQSASTAQQYSGNPPKPINGTWWIWNANSGSYEDTGIKSVLSIVKSYPSIAEMESDVGNMHEGDLVIIATEDISDPDNSKLYVHNGLTWNYLSDLSGIEGVGIANIEQTGGTHAPGTTDTYTITLTDGSTYSFTVYNGADGQGAGDMLKSVYDSQGRNTDIFAYVDEAVSGVTITTDATPTDGSANPVQSGGVYTALSQKQDNITGQQGQVVGFDASGKPVAQAAPDTGVISFNGRKGEVSPGDDDYSASMIKFTDGQTFQQKYDSGQLTGPAGANGSNGQDGSPGADGEDGGYYQPSVDGSGNLNWTASKPGMPAVSGANIKGATGPAGTNGKDATINGQNVLNLIEGTNISFNQSGGNLTINAEGGGGVPVVTTGGTGAAYTATVPGISELYKGFMLTVIPHVNSTTRNATLNVNGTGAKLFAVYDSAKAVIRLPTTDAFLSAGFPVTLVYIPEHPDMNPDLWAILQLNAVDAEDIIVSANTNYTTNQVRGISLQTSTPSKIPNGSIVGVYST